MPPYYWKLQDLGQHHKSDQGSQLLIILELLKTNL